MSAPSCSTCRHRRLTMTGPECWHPAVTAQDSSVLAGNGFGPLCSITREYGPCGLEGRLWESRRASPHVPGGETRPGWLARVWEAMTS